jgi:hypothetical protein
MIEFASNSHRSTTVLMPWCSALSATQLLANRSMCQTLRPSCHSMHFTQHCARTAWAVLSNCRLAIGKRDCWQRYSTNRHWPVRRSLLLLQCTLSMQATWRPMNLRIQRYDDGAVEKCKRAHSQPAIVEPVPTNRSTTSTKYPRTRSLHPQVAGLFRCSSIISKAQVVGRRISLRLSKSSLIQSHFDPINTHTHTHISLWYDFWSEY